MRLVLSLRRPMAQGRTIFCSWTGPICKTLRVRTNMRSGYDTPRTESSRAMKRTSPMAPSTTEITILAAPRFLCGFRRETGAVRVPFGAPANSPGQRRAPGTTCAKSPGCNALPQATLAVAGHVARAASYVTYTDVASRPPFTKRVTRKLGAWFGTQVSANSGTLCSCRTSISCNFPEMNPKPCTSV